MARMTLVKTWRPFWRLGDKFGDLGDKPFSKMQSLPVFLLGGKGSGVMKILCMTSRPNGKYIRPLLDHGGVVRLERERLLSSYPLCRAFSKLLDADGRVLIHCEKDFGVLSAV
ncbi:hypothetical protein AVEN_218622-1 [Araneus ventricosus]|uniref:Uncharacterized protein n=1 Tax=Araneus ventricosus TaxID=182803 RepID=A0A4Y2JTT4_ARAVE|nr:hypothetical protein AVEN_218622-1 [Araneus ventricosus]